MGAVIPMRYAGNKSDTYAALTLQIETLLNSEADLLANLANIVAVLHHAFDFHWTGFYLRRDHDLVLGPFQGPMACTRIPVDPSPRGVCGRAAVERKTIVVADVAEFPGHITCSPLSRSEIVVPLVARDRTEMVLDVDSTDLNAFDLADQAGLENIMHILERRYFR